MKHSYRLSLIALALAASFVPHANAANEAEERAKRQLALLQKKLDTLQQGFSEQEKVLREANKRNVDLQRELTSAKTVIRWIGANPAALQKIGAAETSEPAADGTQAKAEVAAAAAIEAATRETTATAAEEKAAAAGAEAAATAAAATKAKPSLPLRPAPAALRPASPATDSASLFDVLADPIYAGGAAAVALGGGALLWSRRRRKQTPVFEDSLLAHNPPTKNIVIGSTGGAVIDTTLAMNSIFKEEDLGAVSLDPSSIDPVAEAEVYLAYGRDTQAEEILLDALSKMPDRQDVRLKLLDIYAARGDLRAFESTLAEMQSIGVNKDDSIWQRVVILSAGFGPKNPLVGHDAEVAQPAVDAPAAPVVPTVIAPAEINVHSQPAAEFPLNLDLPASAADDRLPDTIEMALVGGNADEDMGDDVVSLEVDEQQERGLDLLLPDMDVELPTSQVAEAGGQEQASAETPVIEIVEEKPLTPAVVAAEEPTPMVSRINPDTLLNFDFEFDSSGPADSKPMPVLEPLADAAETPSLSLDFGSISLDLGGQSSAGETRSEPEAIDLAMDNIASVDEDPIDIKISLARAYMDMGDRDSANEILQEVLDEGNATQGKLAREMLEDMRSAA